MRFDERITALRKRRGLSQEELGFELGVSRQTVSKWESGQSYPDFQRLVLLADFEVSLDELVRGLDVADVRALNDSEKQLSSLYADVEGAKATMGRYVRVLLAIGAAVLAFFAGIVCYAVAFAS